MGLGTVSLRHHSKFFQYFKSFFSFQILAMAKAFHLCVILILAAQVILTTQDPLLQKCFDHCKRVARECGLNKGKGKVKTARH